MSVPGAGPVLAALFSLVAYAYFLFSLASFAVFTAPPDVRARVAAAHPAAASFFVYSVDAHAPLAPALYVPDVLAEPVRALGDVDVDVRVSSSLYARLHVSTELLLALLNVAVLLAPFVVQHAIMARGWYKHLFCRFVGSVRVERSTFVVFASAGLHLVMARWSTAGVLSAPLLSVPADVTVAASCSSHFALDVGLGTPALEFSACAAHRALVHTLARYVNATLAATLVHVASGAWAFGWLLVLASSFNIDHFALFGLKQGFGRLTDARDYVGRSTVTPDLHVSGLYRFVRHPLMLGFLVAFWASPTWSLGRLVLSTMLSWFIYVTVVALEEPSLHDELGVQYDVYCSEVPRFCPMPLLYSASGRRTAKITRTYKPQ